MCRLLRSVSGRQGFPTGSVPQVCSLLLIVTDTHYTYTGTTLAGAKWTTTVACLLGAGAEAAGEAGEEGAACCQAVKAEWATRWGRKRTSGQSMIMAAGPSVEAPMTCSRARTHSSFSFKILIQDGCASHCRPSVRMWRDS